MEVGKIFFLFIVYIGENDTFLFFRIIVIFQLGYGVRVLGFLLIIGELFSGSVGGYLYFFLGRLVFGSRE